MGEQPGLEWMTEQLGKPSRDEDYDYLGAFPVNYIPKDEIYKIYNPDSQTPTGKNYVGDYKGIVLPAETTSEYLEEFVLVPLHVSEEEIQDKSDLVKIYRPDQESQSLTLDYDKVFYGEMIGKEEGTDGPTDGGSSGTDWNKNHGEPFVCTAPGDCIRIGEQQ